MAKKINPRKGEEFQGTSSLHFFGEHQKPDKLDKLLDRRFIHGDRKIPDALQKLMTTKSIYLHAEKDASKPDIKIEQVKIQEARSAWKIELPINERLQGGATALFGNSVAREKAETFRSQTDMNVSFNSYRPSWIDGTFSPKIMTQSHFRKMKRFNKKSINPLYTFGSEDRWEFRDPAWPWGLVGKVFTSSGWTGSGVLIGDRLIATAGHVVPWHDNPWWIRFVPAYYDGSSLHGAGVESYVSDVRGYDVDGSVTGYDWAVCRLYEPLGSYLGYFGYNGYSSDWENDPYWSIIGYPSKIAGAERPSFQGSVSSDDTDGDSNGGLEIETKADLTPGNSGGPMFGWWNGDPRVIGVVSGEEEEWSPGFWPWDWADTSLTNVIAGGAGFTNLMAWARTNWPL
jgi:V8-like Glu-specific endopeptidase